MVAAILWLLPAIVGASDAEPSHDGVYQGRHYRLRATIVSPERYRNVPYSVQVDFGTLLIDQKRNGAFDRFSVIVKRFDSKSGELQDVHYNLSNDFLTTNKGKVNWLIEDTNDNEYVIFYDVKEHGPFTPPEYVGLVGNGDSLHYNDGKLHPLFGGMCANPVAADWGGDGVTDIITAQIWSFTRHSPEFGVWYYRNEGANQRPVFGEGIPLRFLENGEYHYLSTGLCVDALDWNGDGLLDIVTNEYIGRTVTIYLNTGKKDEVGMPILKKSETIETRAGGYPCFKFVDLHGDGRMDLVVSFLGGACKANIDDPLWFKTTDEERKKATWPRWYSKYFIDYYENAAGPGQPPKFGPPVRLKTTDGAEISWYVAPCLEFLDWDGDGKDELLTMRNSPVMEKGYAGVEMYKNVGTASVPVFKDCGLVQGLQDRTGMYFRKVDTPAFKGLLVSPSSLAGKVRYYELGGRDKSRQIVLKDRGYLEQRNTYVNPSSGYVQAHLSDWENNGSWDLTMGCETGWVTRSRNIGTQKRPVYSETEFLEQDGKPLELLQGPFSDPGSIMESPLGQTAPTYLDWDGDGIMDLLVCMGRKFLFYKNVGTSLHPKLLKPADVTTFDGKPVHDFRDKPVVMDWDGDGLVDVVGCTNAKTCFFKRYKDAAGELKLASGVPFKFADGSPMNVGGWMNVGGCLNAADWDNRGVYDLFSSSWNKMLYTKNVGANAKPSFLPTVAMAVDGESLSVGNHVTTPLPVDWDKSGKLDILASGESGLLYLYRRSYLDGIHSKIQCRLQP